MNRLKLVLLTFFLLSLSATFLILKQTPSDLKFDLSLADQTVSPFSNYYKAEVLEYSLEENRFSAVLQGGKKIENVENSSQFNKVLKSGDKVILGSFEVEGEKVYVFTEKDRSYRLLFVVFLFFALAVFLGRLHGLTSLFGMCFGIFILISFVAPQILIGKDPVLVISVAVTLIAVVSVYISHGLNALSALTTISTLATLLFSGLLAWVSVWFVKLNGSGSETAYLIQNGFGGQLDLKGILFCGILIGILGVVDDITSTQIAAATEIYRANPKISFVNLYKSVMRIGREHVASLVNTLVLAYAGASFPLFLLLNTLQNQPLFVLLNSEFVAEEIVRTLVGSMALLLAVPISSLIAVTFLIKKGDLVELEANSHKH